MEQPDYYIVFRDGDIWTAKFLKKGFGHITIVACDEYNWLALEPLETHLKWEILPVTKEDSPFEKYWPNSTVLRVNPVNEKPKWIGKIGLLSCVLFAKYILGIKSYSFTPHQLYKYILKNELGERHGHES